MVGSGVEAEYRAMTHIASELMWLKKLLQELGFSRDKSMAMYCDNQAE